MAGRIVLLNSILLMSPVYLLAHCLVPASVLQRAEKAARSFLWQGTAGHGLHYIAWDIVCRPKDQGGLGLHSLLRWRDSLLARHAFRFLNDKDSLFHLCLAARYGSSLAVPRFRRADSSSWKLLCRGYQFLSHALSWEVGDGVSISFLTDNWINGRSLLWWPTYINVDVDIPALVSAFISADRSWLVDNLHQFCGCSLVQYISQVPLPTVACPDVAVLSNRYCGCSVSSFVYRSIWNEAPWDFRWVWKLRLNPKEAVFWWRVCHDAIPTGAWLCRRGFGLVHPCPWGCVESEDLSHVLIHCGFVMQVFQIFTGWGLAVPHFTSLPNLFAWLARCSRHRDKVSWATLVCSILYQCWRNRNDKVHGRPFVSPRLAAVLFLSHLSCGRQSPIKFWDTTAFSGDLTPTVWCPPPDGWLKANFDGAFYPNGRGGFAMVIRDHFGNLVTAMGGPVRHWDCSAVEMMGFQLIKDILVRCSLPAAGLIIEGDNLNVISHLQAMARSVRDNSEEDIFHLLAARFCLHNVIISHIVREQNCCADCAAHIALGSTFVWDPGTPGPPHFCNILLGEKPL